mmetsp:Transcript_55726/g.132857  ORF Transcript_55726/g.132857 Transcript_55726/m.132857 type:complete len:142 (-) Transcript_55726:419-844(-)
MAEQCNGAATGQNRADMTGTLPKSAPPVPPNIVNPAELGRALSSIMNTVLQVGTQVHQNGQMISVLSSSQTALISALSTRNQDGVGARVAPTGGTRPHPDGVDTLPSGNGNNNVVSKAPPPPPPPAPATRQSSRQTRSNPY